MYVCILFSCISLTSVPFGPWFLQIDYTYFSNEVKLPKSLDGRKRPSLQRLTGYYVYLSVNQSTHSLPPNKNLYVSEISANSRKEREAMLPTVILGRYVNQDLFIQFSESSKAHFVVQGPDNERCNWHPQHSETFHSIHSIYTEIVHRPYCDNMDFIYLHQKATIIRHSPQIRCEDAHSCKYVFWDRKPRRTKRTDVLK